MFGNESSVVEPLKGIKTNSICTLTLSVANPDLQIRGKGARSFTPWDKGGSQKHFFWPFGLQFGLKIMGGGGGGRPTRPLLWIRHWVFIKLSSLAVLFMMSFCPFGRQVKWPPHDINIQPATSVAAAIITTGITGILWLLIYTYYYKIKILKHFTLYKVIKMKFFQFTLILSEIIW